LGPRKVDALPHAITPAIYGATGCATATGVRIARSLRPAATARDLHAPRANERAMGSLAAGYMQRRFGESSGCRMPDGRSARYPSQPDTTPSIGARAPPKLDVRTPQSRKIMAARQSMTMQEGKFTDLRATRFRQDLACRATSDVSCSGHNRRSGVSRLCKRQPSHKRCGQHCSEAAHTRPQTPNVP
jgi:hypothetical protein